MAHESHAIHHMHKQQRAIEAVAEIEGLNNAEVTAAVLSPSNKFKRLLDKVVYFTGIFSVMMAIPQVLHIWIKQNAGGLSLITWATFMVNAVIWSIYGIFHKEKPIIIMYISYFIIDTLIVIGILKFG